MTKLPASEQSMISGPASSRGSAQRRSGLFLRRNQTNARHEKMPRHGRPVLCGTGGRFAASLASRGQPGASSGSLWRRWAGARAGACLVPFWPNPGGPWLVFDIGRFLATPASASTEKAWFSLWSPARARAWARVVGSGSGFGLGLGLGLGLDRGLGGRSGVGYGLGLG